MWPLIMILVFGSACLLGWVFFPPAADTFLFIQKKRTQKLANTMDRMFIKVRFNRLVFVYTALPLGLGVAGYLFFPQEIRLLGCILGVLGGLIGPSLYVKHLTEKRKAKFNEQLIDALMILSSSLKGGLSLIQTIEVVTEEMPDPISQEFSILLGENKMGVSLEESFTHLYGRMPSIALHHMITAILLVRETGGNLPVIFSRIISTIRENKKIRQNIDNLTLQGKIQGVVMTLLPIVFALIVTTTNKNFFDALLKSDIGRTLLVYAVCSEVIGSYLIWKISLFKEL